jgi:hypothetical protein
LVGPPYGLLAGLFPAFTGERPAAFLADCFAAFLAGARFAAFLAGERPTTFFAGRRAVRLDALTAGLFETRLTAFPVARAVFFVLFLATFFAAADAFGADMAALPFRMSLSNALAANRMPLVAEMLTGSPV